MPNIAMVLVHGVGGTDQGAMMKACAAHLNRIRPNWNISNSISETHQVGTADGAVEIRQGSQGQQRIFLANVYWGNVSLVSGSILQAVGGFFVNMLGLRHFAAASVDPDTAIGGLLRWLFGAFALLIAVVDIPLNLLTFLYSSFVFHRNDGIAGAVTHLLITAAVGAIAAFAIWSFTPIARRRRPLIAWSIGNAGMLCATLALIALSLPYSHAAVRVSDALVAHYGNRFNLPFWIDVAKFPVCNDSAPPCITLSGKILSGLYVAQLGPLLLETLLSAAILIIVLPLAIYRWLAGRNVAGLLLALASVHTIWFLFGSVLLFVVPGDLMTRLAVQSSFSPPQDIVGFRAPWFEVVPALGFIVVALIAAFGATALRWAHKFILWRRAPQSVADDAPLSTGAIVGPRLLVLNVMLVATIIGALLIDLHTITLLTSEPGHSASEWLRLIGMVQMECAAETVCLHWDRYSHLTLAVPIGLLALGASLHVGLKSWTDIVDHFTRRGLLAAKGTDKYPVRKEIAERFKDSVDCVLDFAKGNAHEDPPHLIILAHSQGTVIAFDRIKDGYLSDILDTKRASRITFITAGSPLSHIYQHYFPREYSDFRVLDGMNWLNVYRIDDYVGTRINGPDGFPLNRALELGGHTKYWSADRPDTFDEIAKVLPP